MPERRKVFAENMSNFRKDRDDIRHKNTQIAARDQQKAIVATNKSAEKERIASEKEFLENLAKEPKLWADAEKARKKYGDNSAEAKQAEYLRDKNQSSINDFKSNYTGSLSDIPGYNDQVKENNFAMAAYQSGMTREANAEQQKQHDAAQAAFQKRRDEAAKQAKEAQKAADKKDSDDAAFFTKLQTAVNRKIKAYDDFIKAEPWTRDWVSKSGKNSIADNNLLDLQNQATATGLSSDQRYSLIMDQYRRDIDAVNEAQQKRAKIEEEAIKVQDKDISSLQKFIKTVDAYKGSIEKDNKTDMPVYANVTNIRGSANDLLNRLQKDTSGDKDQVAID